MAWFNVVRRGLAWARCFTAVYTGSTVVNTPPRITLFSPKCSSVEITYKLINVHWPLLSRRLLMFREEHRFFVDCYLARKYYRWLIIVWNIRLLSSEVAIVLLDKLANVLYACCQYILAAPWPHLNELKSRSIGFIMTEGICCCLLSKSMLILQVVRSWKTNQILKSDFQ